MRLRVLPSVVFPLFVLGMSWLSLAAAAVAEDKPASSVLRLTNGGLVPGELRGSDDPKVMRWHSPYFAQPLEFPVSAIHSVHSAVAGPPPKPVGEFCFELAGDDMVYGHLLGVTEADVEVDGGRLGHIHLRREQIRRFYRWKGADAIFLGPNGLAGWKDSAVPPQWHEEGGQLSTEQPGASLFGDLGIPDKAVIDVEFSWKAKPDFIFALGTGEREGAGPSAFQLEIWDDELVAVGESARDADVASVRQVGAGEGRVRVQACLDQQQGRLILLSPGGKPLATLHINGRNRPGHSGVRLTNTKGDVRLEHLRITRWNGLPPHEVREDESRLHRTDGSVVYGRLTAFDPAAKEFTLGDATNETRVGQDAVADVFLAPSLLVAKAANDAAAGRAEPTLRVVYRDGTRLTGRLTRVEDTHLTIACPGVKEPLRLPLAGLRSLLVLQGGEAPAERPVAGKPGRLELEGVDLKGRLIGGSAQPGASCLVWHANLALNASALVPGVSGRIVYRDPPPPPPTLSVPGGMRVINRANGVVRFQAVAPPQKPGFLPGQVHIVTNNAPAQPPSSGRPSLHLRSGDTIPCEVTRIDEKGVTFRTRLSDATFVAHEKIKGVELIALRFSPQLDEVKRDRLLTLPRTQRDSPPTHLICSTTGDFLRGRVLEMDDKKVKVEVRLETREIPRERIAQIIWLHADELTGRKPAPADPAPANRVQTLRADGNRLTFVAQKADSTVLSGTSDVLRACRADLAEVDQLLFGTFIEESAAKLAYHRWKLHYATEPKYAQDDAGAAADGRLTGMESPLVGQAAFPFRLDLLDGKKFHLAEHKGRVVVLEFWATWCGPCLQSMPLIDGVVREFADQKVELIAVNLEEQPDKVKALLERHKLQVPVALDRDGVVAAKYTVTAIPQTVLIDRDGKIARLFVGGGKKTAEALRTALQELTAGKPAAGAAP